MTFLCKFFIVLYMYHYLFTLFLCCLFNVHCGPYWKRMYLSNMLSTQNKVQCSYYYYYDLLCPHHPSDTKVKWHIAVDHWMAPLAETPHTQNRNGSKVSRKVCSKWLSLHKQCHKHAHRVKVVYSWATQKSSQPHNATQNTQQTGQCRSQSSYNNTKQ